MFKQNKQRKSVKKGKLYWKEALDWGSTVTISLALTSEFEWHHDYLELFSSSLQLTHSLNSHLILSFLYLFRSATSLLCFDFLWFLFFFFMIWAAGNPQIFRVWPPKNLPKIQNFHLRKAGAATLFHSAAALGLHPKLLLSGFSVVAVPSKRRDAVMRFRNIVLGH